MKPQVLNNLRIIRNECQVLSRRQRSVILLRHVGLYSINEISDALAISAKSVTEIKDKGMKRLEKTVRNKKVRKFLKLEEL